MAQSESELIAELQKENATLRRRLRNDRVRRLHRLRSIASASRHIAIHVFVGRRLESAIRAFVGAIGSKAGPTADHVSDLVAAIIRRIIRVGVVVVVLAWLPQIISIIQLREMMKANAEAVKANAELIQANAIAAESERYERIALRAELQAMHRQWRQWERDNKDVQLVFATLSQLEDTLADLLDRIGEVDPLNDVCLCMLTPEGTIDQVLRKDLENTFFDTIQGVPVAAVVDDEDLRLGVERARRLAEVFRQPVNGHQAGGHHLAILHETVSDLRNAYSMHLEIGQSLKPPVAFDSIAVD
jgi:ABC-type multidrug transport system fused ATPase/permease subunit